jgi:FAD binding domain
MPPAAGLQRASVEGRSGTGASGSPGRVTLSQGAAASLLAGPPSNSLKARLSPHQAQSGPPAGRSPSVRAQSGPPRQSANATRADSLPPANLGFEGNLYAPGSASYDRANDLYATSTYGKERKMDPGTIWQPTSTEDIQKAVRYANEIGKPLAIRTGGHQYSGASSTGPDGIQLDLKPTFRRPNLDLQLLRENGKVYIRSSVSWTLAEMFDFLQDNGVFMPTGQCIGVCVGGHIQTGGYGMLARSFGLLGDYVRELEIVDHNAKVVKVTKDSNPDLFYGILGGSPGNFGVITHFKVEVQEDRKHQGSKGLWQAFHYRPDTLKALLDILVKKGEDPNFPHGYDFTVNIVSREVNLAELFPGSQSELKRKLPDSIYDGKKNIADLIKFKFALIIVYAQWVNLGEEPYSPDLFNQIKKVPHDFEFHKETVDETPMSQIASWWLFRSAREFPYPYDKRTNSTASTELSKTKWSGWFTERANKIISQRGNGLYISSQLQVYGGTNSKFRTNAGNGTSYTFRDATVGGSCDVFYDGNEKGAHDWQAQNDKEARTYFSKEERGVLWGSYGDWNMKNEKVWRRYYDADTYKKLQKIRKKADPKGTFTPNPFCVEAAED